MPSSTNKKAVVARFDRDALSGYVNMLSFVGDTGVEVLQPNGDCLTIPVSQVKIVTFVRDLESPLPPPTRTFLNRPKTEGLWVRLRFRDGDQMEGILPNNLLQIESAGFSVIPPGQHGHSQHVFVPRTALESVEVLGVIGSPLKKPKTPPKDQIGLFDA